MNANDIPLPPHSDTAEAGALGCVLDADSKDAAHRFEQLQAEYFYDLRHQTLYEALLTLHRAGKPLGVPELYGTLQATDKMGVAGGMDYVQRLPEQTPSPANFPYWLDQLKDFAQRREKLREAASLRLAALEGLPQEKTAGVEPVENDEELFQRLAKLSPADYDRRRESEAERAGIRVGTLDGEVNKRRPKDETEEAAQGSRVEFSDIEPWGDPVNGADLLNEIRMTLERFVIAPPPALIAASLFVLHTYAFDLGEISPILFITGPTKRCGKSKLLAILSRLVCRPFASASATPAGIYRVIELHHPTLCIDEVDAFVHGDEQLRGLINSGHTRDAAYHLGCAATGDKEFEPRRWSTWTPKIFSGIGRLADTIEDRAVIIQMVRRKRNEPCERLRHGMKFDEIPRKALRFVNDHAEAIRNGNPHVPDSLHDRAADNWMPLLILADLAGGDWPAKARQAAVALSGGDEGESLGTTGQLLADIRDLFTADRTDKLPSEELAAKLADIEGRPWAEWGKQRRPISKNQLANLLRGFGVSSRSLRMGDRTLKGYAIEDFTDAFSRYLPQNEVAKRNNVTSVDNIDENAGFKGGTPKPCSVAKNDVSINKDAQCYVVPFQSGKLKEAAML